ncbi:hypothetical protein SAMN07250955_105232 [Arboricoccus pini]|uniref:Uncharacterized protein n=1 Tax=Arboricoccus pini TaxID=1963835 RepID=A0A212R501_9PROT|nr:hypothetical protein [Arboricoccus pini]SNB66991.1 hypothetical protein SAMN07250955_105232 [Arboricoccus pini]
MNELVSNNAVEPSEASAAASDEGVTAELGATTAQPIRPANVPEIFWDAERGAVLTDKLLRAHLDLLATLPSEEDPVPLISDEAATSINPNGPNELADCGHPYEIEPPHPLLASNEDVNLKLRHAGLSQEQAQIVYNLAAEVLVPLIENVAWDNQAAQHVARLSQDFGGAEAWARTAQQLRTWGRANLAPQVYTALASDPEGIHAMHQMMRS